MKPATITGAHMQRLIGDLIQRQRRLKHLTQAELGDNRVSKSYISAIERGKTHISSELLHFFAQKLELPENYFLEAAEAINEIEQRSQHVSVQLPPPKNYQTQNEILSLLETVKEHDDYYQKSFPRQALTLAPGVIELLPLAKRARYYLLKGKFAQEKQELTVALQAFESALTFASEELQPVILDYLGQNYALAEFHRTALNYHQRALALVSSSPETIPTKFLFLLKLHYGDDYYALENFEEAYKAYEQASMHLSMIPEVNISSQLYWRMGHCLSITINQSIASAFIRRSPSSLEEVEQTFNHARDLLSQSVILYRVCRNLRGENKARLVLTQTLLDQNYWHTLLASENGLALSSGKNSFTPAEVEEQCYQILQNNYTLADPQAPPASEDEGSSLLALGYLIDAHIQSTHQVRYPGEHEDKAILHLQKAMQLYQKGLIEARLSWHTIRQILQTQTTNASRELPHLPILPDTSRQEIKSQPDAIPGLLEIYFAMGEAAEILSSITTNKEIQQTSYRRANQFFNLAHLLAKEVTTKNVEGTQAAFRFYRRCVLLFERRQQQDSPLAEETNDLLLDILRTSFEHIQMSMLH
ncbi:MAG TPA: helix-turn-helix transcriptional regulator [Ktedonobacteraceae bacterium]|nr:helix-turn-helix transcriptional regulator [Ktedonobacteraceae bacterium]